MPSGVLNESIATFRGQKALAEKAIAQLSDEQLRVALDADTNSVAVIIKHMAGNMVSRWTDLLTADGEKPDRDRDGEFVDTFRSRAEVMACWDAGWARLFQTLSTLTDPDLTRVVNIRGQPHTVARAILRQVDHYGYHVGQIVLIARVLAKDRWQVITIPKGGSRAFNEGVAGRAAPYPLLDGIALVRTMKVAANVIIALTALACVVALALSVYPGVLNDLLFIGFLLSFLVLPFVGIAVAVGLVILARQGKLRGLRIPWMRVAIVFALLFGTYVQLKFYVPRRIAFAASRASFEEMVPQATPSDNQRTSLNRRLGVYNVDEYAADARGGVYFRVYSGGDGIGPDRMSYGFAYKPNREGTPFGAARYRLFRLGNDWYWFRASDDWH